MDFVFRTANTTSDPVLPVDTVAVDIDVTPLRFKVGNGVLTWGQLPYTTLQGPQGIQGPPGEASTVPGPPGTTDYDLLTNKPILGTAAAANTTDFATSTHNHTGVYEPANANLQTHVTAPHAPAGATVNSPDATLLARANHTGSQSADTLTDGTTNKAFLGTERTKLSGISAGATVNSSDATLLARANHTGTQAATTIVEDATHRWATDAEKTTWNAKESTSNKGVANGYAGLDATGKVPTAQLPPLGGGSDPAWYGNIYSCRGNCDPHDALRVATNGGSVAATPTGITITVARISYFRPPANITFNKIRFYGVGATTNVYRVAIYNADTLARVTSELPFTTAANTWGAAGAALNISLTAGQLYFAAVSVNATGTTAGVLCLGPTVAATTGQIAVLPKSWPGNLDVDLGFISSGYAQFAVTTGALPATAPTIAAQAAWTGGFPLFFLDANNA